MTTLCSPRDRLEWEREELRATMRAISPTLSTYAKLAIKLKHVEDRLARTYPLPRPSSSVNNNV